jgi:hypothetical protein
MICPTRFVPGDFAIENNFSHWHARKGRGDTWGILRQVISREQAHIVAVSESKQSDSIEFALENPLWSGESFLRESRRHRLNPFRKGHERIMTDVKRSVGTSRARGCVPDGKPEAL